MSPRDPLLIVDNYIIWEFNGLYCFLLGVGKGTTHTFLLFLVISLAYIYHIPGKLVSMTAFRTTLFEFQTLNNDMMFC